MKSLMLVLSLLLLASPAAARCLSYEPAVVTLAGEVRSRTVPGPPGYANIARGDIPETIYVLALAEPVCVSADPSSKLNAKSAADVREVQLSVAKDKVRFLVGKQVHATGSLFHAHTGHHRTPVVLRVSKLSGDPARP